MEVQVIVTQDGETGFDYTPFWVSPTAVLDPPTLDIFVTQDDPRVIVSDVLNPRGNRTGYEVKLQRKSGSTWLDVETIPITGDASSFGAGRTFANQGSGTYRGAGRSIDSADTSNNSPWVFTDEIEIAQDFPDLIPGPPPVPLLQRREADLLIDYADPDDDGGTHLVRFVIELYRNGTTLANRIISARLGVRRGRRFVCYNVGLRSGTYRARVAADNANSADSGEARNWSAMSPPVVVE